MADKPAPKSGATTRRQRKKKAAVDTRRQVEFLYRGQAIKDILALPWDQQLQLMPSRSRRFFSRQLDHDTQVFFEKIKESKDGDELRTHLRDFPVIPQMVGKLVHIHNGKEFQKIGITSEMIGHKLGEFALTRKSVKHTGPGVGATRSSKFMPLK